MEADLVLKEIEQNPIYETICNMIEENTKTMEQMGSISVESSIIEDKCIPVTKVFTQHMSKKFIELANKVIEEDSESEEYTGGLIQ